MLNPSGLQIEIAFEAQRAVVVEVGGGLRTYVANGLELLNGYPADEMCMSGRGQVLTPWPNRIENGHYEFGGDSHQLPLTEPENQNAIHGLVRWANWSVAEQSPERVALEYRLHPQPGYPFMLDLRIEYVLSADGLQVRSTATNAGHKLCPFGSGMHPYLTLGTATIDTLVLQAPCRIVMQSNERGIPVNAACVEETAFDFRQPRQIDGTVLDNAFTGLERDRNGIARVLLQDPDGGNELTFWVDEGYSYLMLFTGDPLPDVDRRALAIEPMTCPPNAFRTGHSLIILAPGESFTSTWGITPTVVEHQP